jgi:hypothetical protein
MGATVGRVPRGLPGLGNSNALLGGRNMPQPAGAAKLLSSGGQKTMPIPGAPHLPFNPFPERARQRQRLGLF